MFDLGKIIISLNGPHSARLRKQNHDYSRVACTKIEINRKLETLALPKKRQSVTK
jgi:hypothetical protein